MLGLNCDQLISFVLFFPCFLFISPLHDSLYIFFCSCRLAVKVARSIGMTLHATHSASQISQHMPQDLTSTVVFGLGWFGLVFIWFSWFWFAWGIYSSTLLKAEQPWNNYINCPASSHLPPEPPRTIQEASSSKQNPPTTLA